MRTRSIIAIAIFAVLAIVGTRIILDPPHGTAQAQDAKTEIKSDMKMSHDENNMEHEMGEKFTVGDITIMEVRARETVLGASVGGGYMVITNNGSVDDRLVSGTTSVSPMLEIHEMSMENDVMKMRQLNDGLMIKAGETVTLEPGGFHVMFMGLEAPLAKDTSFTATLNFENAGSVDIDFNVVDMKTMMKH